MSSATAPRTFLAPSSSFVCLSPLLGGRGFWQVAVSEGLGFWRVSVSGGTGRMRAVRSPVA